MVELNKTHYWQPEVYWYRTFWQLVGNLNDWELEPFALLGNTIAYLARRKRNEKCIGSVEELYNEIENAVAAGVMKRQSTERTWLHSGRFISKENYDSY